MPIPIPADTRTALGADLSACNSRVLRLERFADPALREEPRKSHFLAAINQPCDPCRAHAWQSYVTELQTGGTARVIYAQLQARLMVNMAGGVMENAGLCLDRFGMPYIPGSAVKGCARRAALAALREWCETGTQLGTGPTDQDNLFAKACARSTTPADMLAAIARVFGWCDQDWSSESPKSDFAWAANTDPAVLGTARAAVAKYLNRPADDLGAAAGTVSFLLAYPVALGQTGRVDALPARVPELGKLELDIVTCHHRAYYDGALAVATDTEEPNPVVFPAVAAGHVFAFALNRRRSASPEDLALASAWLACGLTAFGVGAKTNAGYGWFAEVTEAIEGARERAIQQARDAEQARRQAEEAERARAQLQPDPELLAQLKTLKETDLRGRINPYAAEPKYWSESSDRVQLTILHFLLVESPEIFKDDRSKPQSKIAKALAHLSAKFPNRGFNQ